VKYDWAKNWNFTTAVMRLAFEPARYEVVDNHESCLPNVINDVFDGHFGRLQQREDMKSLVVVLPHVVDSLRRKMITVGLDRNAELPPVVWLRLMHNAGLKPVDVATREFEHWQEKMRANGMTILYRRFDDTKGKFVGPARERDGIGTVTGYTVEEILVEQRKKPNWPYCHQWKFFREPSVSVVVPKIPQVQVVPPKLAPEISEKIPKVKVGVNRPMKRRKRSRQDVERACGRRVLVALEECLAAEFSRKRNGVLEAGRKKDYRTYKCQLSLNELVSELRRKYGKQLTCSDSTLKSALPYFVACPRGRPGGLD
jgi:hypothetical protein